MNHNDEFSRILDDALAEYRNAEPLAGIESRVLQRLRLHSERKRQPWWQWSAAALAAAVLVFAVWTGTRQRVRPPSVPPVVTEKETPAQGTGNQAPKIASRQPFPTQQLPRQKSFHSRRDSNELQRSVLATVSARTHAQFPTPEPLTAEERALLALARTDPQALQTLPVDNKQEIAIAPIEIKPLAEEDAVSKGDN